MANNFKPTAGSQVSKKDAQAWIDKYDQEMRPDKEKDPKSFFYGRDALLKLLSEEGSAGITFFFALKYNEAIKKDSINLVLVSATEDGTLLWGTDPTAKGGGGVGTFDVGTPCPPYCPK